jgi:phage tail tube protein FII
MAASVIVMEAANIFCGDDSGDNSKHLTLTNLTLWQPKEKTVEHHAGGSIGAITIGGLGFEAPEMSFTLGACDVQTKMLFGIGGNGTRPYTVYQALRDKNGGRLIERKIVVFGRLIEVGENEFKRGDSTEQTHKISEITRYDYTEDKASIYLYDYFASTWSVGGVNQLAEHNSILRIP